MICPNKYELKALDCFCLNSSTTELSPQMSPLQKKKKKQPHFTQMASELSDWRSLKLSPLDSIHAEINSGFNGSDKISVSCVFFFLFQIKDVLSSLDRKDTLECLAAQQRGRKPVQREPFLPPEIEDLWLLQIKVSPTENNALHFVPAVAPVSCGRKRFTATSVNIAFIYPLTFLKARMTPWEQLFALAKLQTFPDASLRAIIH